MTKFEGQSEEEKEKKYGDLLCALVCLCFEGSHTHHRKAGLDSDKFYSGIMPIRKIEKVIPMEIVLDDEAKVIFSQVVRPTPDTTDSAHMSWFVKEVAVLQDLLSKKASRVPMSAKVGDMPTYDELQADLRRINMYASIIQLMSTTLLTKEDIDEAIRRIEVLKGLL